MKSYVLESITTWSSKDLVYIMWLMSIYRLGTYTFFQLDLFTIIYFYFFTDLG